MSETRSWFARQLGTAPPAQPQAYQPPPQQYAPPQGYPQQPQGYPQQQGYPPQGYPQQQAPMPPQAPVITSIHDVPGAMGMWQGGEGVRTETNRCPGCGGDHYFSRSKKTSRGPAPAPLCYDCGFNGLFDQADQATWASGVA